MRSVKDFAAGQSRAGERLKRYPMGLRRQDWESWGNAPRRKRREFAVSPWPVLPLSVANVHVAHDRQIVPQQESGDFPCGFVRVR